MGLISRVSSRTYRSNFCTPPTKTFKKKPSKSKWPKDVYMAEESSLASEAVSNNNTKTKPSSNSKVSPTKTKPNGTLVNESPTFTKLRRTPKLLTKRNLDLELFGVRL